MTQNYQDFMNAVHESAEMEQGGGSAAICFASVAFGFPVFATGLSIDERFFPAPPGKANTEIQKEQKKAARALASEYGLDPDRVRYSLQIHYHAEDAIKKDEDLWVYAGWNGDMSEIAPLWTMNTEAPSALVDLHVPALKENKIMHDWEGWVKMGYARDPFRVSQGEEGKVDEGLDGEPRFPVVRYITETFPSKKAAYASVEFTGATAEDDDIPGFEEKADVPDGYSPEGWDNMIPAIKEALDGGQPPAKVASDYGVEVRHIIQLM